LAQIRWRVHTAISVLDTKTGQLVNDIDVTRVRFRTLQTSEIARYIATDNPEFCAGSFKIESLGISLFESVESNDPTALIGLPLIKLCAALRQFGLTIP